MNTTLRETIKTIDSRFFAGELRKLNRIRWKYKTYKKQKQYLANMHETFKYNNTVCFTSKNKII